MEFLCEPRFHPRRLGILPGSFNPPTLAHLALAKAALTALDEVLLVLPRSFPHKHYSGATFEQRCGMLRRLVKAEAGLSAAVSDGGLFLDIAREGREILDPSPALVFVCGRDAAERILNWDYGDLTSNEEVLESFELWVAGRHGSYEPAPALRRRVRSLAVPGDWDGVSASEVRRRITDGEPWEHLVPEAIVEDVRTIYRPPE